MQYYRYADQLQRNGQAMEVTVIDTDRVSHGKRTSWYTYEATFWFKNQGRVIPIEKADYERLKTPNSRLAVRYNPALNDFIPADYDPGFSELAVPLFLGLLLVLLLRSGESRPQQARPQEPGAEAAAQRPIG
ncbi:hypothetical protein [Hymenobacter cellulosilyticus]|uniref:DUF3592 domain-containing protein n=1 Tax=Hymenobacter cellulosilyticus TaxID=2932248 RepID=A0A8T9Q7J8_9BACT|nr:hypothetical protein [Hymenobacter cellulosilyticus]UOQ73556.1 hypothetical protein MUN79_06395 [Hymenobacter cellulosilyticus]